MPVALLLSLPPLDNENIYQKNSNCSPSLNITYKEIRIILSLVYIRHFF